MNILSTPTATIEQMYKWLESKKPHLIAKPICTIIWNKAIEKGVNPVVAVTQAVKETGRFHFTGILRPNFCNTCGLKVPKGGACDDPNAHTRFEYWEDGVEAHLDHLCLYAGAKGFPRYNPLCKETNNAECKANGNTLDPRHFPYIYGKAPKVVGLSNNWAGSTYGEAIVDMCKELEGTIVEEISTSEKKEYEIVINKLQENIIILSNTIEDNKLEIRGLKEEIRLLYNMLESSRLLKDALKKFLL